MDRGGKGSHRNFTHPKGVRVTVSGGPATTPSIIRNGTCGGHWSGERVKDMTRK